MKVDNVDTKASFFNVPFNVSSTDKVYNLGYSVFRSIQVAPLKTKILYAIGGIALYYIFASIFDLLTRVDRKLVSNDEVTLRHITTALRRLPECKKGEKIYVFFLRQGKAYNWFEGSEGEFCMHRAEYVQNYKSIVLLGIPLDETANGHISSGGFRSHCCTYEKEKWIYDFCANQQEFPGKHMFPGQYIDLTYAEYRAVRRSGYFPSRIYKMFKTNTFPAAWKED